MNAPIPSAELADVRKAFGKTQALDGVDLRLHAGKVTALLGPNGAGKTTAVGLLLGLQSPDAGRVEVFGLPPHELPARRRCGLMLQTASVPETNTVRELLELTRAYYPNPRSLAECVELAGLDGLLDRRFGKLSGGQQRRVQFAMAICGRPEVLFLDEPSTGLDIEARRLLWASIRDLARKGCAVLLTTHYLEEAEALADEVVVLQRGRVIAQGSVDAIRSHVSRRTIRCRTRLDVTQVGAWPKVQSASTEDGQLSILTGDAEAVVRLLLEADSTLADLEVRRADLGEAFVQLTREAA